MRVRGQGAAAAVHGICKAMKYSSWRASTSTLTSATRGVPPLAGKGSIFPRCEGDECSLLSTELPQQARQLPRWGRNSVGGELLSKVRDKLCKFPNPDLDSESPQLCLEAKFSMTACQQTQKPRPTADKIKPSPSLTTASRYIRIHGHEKGTS